MPDKTDMAAWAVRLSEASKYPWIKSASVEVLCNVISAVLSTAPAAEPAGDAVERATNAISDLLRDGGGGSIRNLARAAIAAACPELQAENERMREAIERAELQTLRWRDAGPAPAGWHAYDRAAKLLRELIEADNG